MIVIFILKFIDTKPMKYCSAARSRSNRGNKDVLFIILIKLLLKFGSKPIRQVRFFKTTMSRSKSTRKGTRRMGNGLKKALIDSAQLTKLIKIDFLRKSRNREREFRISSKVNH